MDFMIVFRNDPRVPWKPVDLSAAKLDTLPIMEALHRLRMAQRRYEFKIVKVVKPATKH